MEPTGRLQLGDMDAGGDASVQWSHDGRRDETRQQHHASLHHLHRHAHHNSRVHLSVRSPAEPLLHSVVWLCVDSVSLVS